MVRTTRSWRQRLLAAVALGAYLAGAIGVPLPAPAPRLAEEEPEQAPAPASAGLHRCGCPAEERDRGTCCCCSQGGGGCCSAPADEAPADEAPGLRWSGGGWTARCQGEESSWLLLATVVVPVPAPPCLFAPSVSGWLRPLDESAGRLALPLPDPPPRAYPS
jgi:hypothetical protein